MFSAPAVLTEWSAFGACSNDCGVGSETRTRTCTVMQENCEPTALSGSCGDAPLSESQCCVGASGCGQFPVELRHQNTRYSLLSQRRSCFQRTASRVSQTKCSCLHSPTASSRPSSRAEPPLFVLKRAPAPLTRHSVTCVVRVAGGRPQSGAAAVRIANHSLGARQVRCSHQRRKHLTAVDLREKQLWSLWVALQPPARRLHQLG